MRKQIYYEEEAIPLVFRMALSYREEKGTPEEIFESHKGLVFDLLKGKRRIINGPEREWDDDVALKFCNGLSLHQKAFLNAVIKAEGKLDADGVRDAFKAEGLPWKNTRSTGGTVTGLTKRARKLKVANAWGWEDGFYFINKEAKPYIKKNI